MLRGIDISNLQGPPEEYRDQPWYQSAQFVIVQAIRPPSPYRGFEVGGYTAAQLRAAKEDGKKVGIYVFLWNTLGAGLRQDIIGRLALVPDDLRLDFRPLVDVEDEANVSRPTRIQSVLTARSVVDAWAIAHKYPRSGGYSRDEYVKDYLGGFWPIDWTYWQARLNDVDPPESELLPMRPTIQWSSHPVDQNIMLDSEIITPQEEETVLIPDEYVIKFSLADNHDIAGLIANFEGVRATAYEEGTAAGSAVIQAKLDTANSQIAAAMASLTPASGRLADAMVALTPAA